MFGRVDAGPTADLVLYNADRGEAYVALSNGRSFGTPALWATGLPRFTTNDFDVQLADVNGDGRADLIFFNHGADDVPGAATAVVALSTGTSFTYPPVPLWNGSWCASYQICRVADVTGDGRADLVAFTPNFGTLWASPSTGYRFGPNAIWNNFFCVRGEICALGDVDGDGKADAIVFKPHAPAGQKGNVLVARSTGSAFTGVRTAHGFFCIDNEQCLVGDVNGDRRTDIVLVKGWSNPTLEVLVSLSNGTNFINAKPFVWANPGHFNGGKYHGSFFSRRRNGRRARRPHRNGFDL